MVDRETRTQTARSPRAKHEPAAKKSTAGGAQFASRRAPAARFDTLDDEQPPRREADLKRNQVVVDGEVYQIAEADMLLDPHQAEIYELDQLVRQAQRDLMARTDLSDAPVAPGGGSTSALVAVGQGGQIVRWAPGVVLSFCVLRETFPEPDQYDIVVQNMQLAAQEWMDTCGVEFRYLPEFDSSPSLRPERVVFPVRYINAHGAFIAAAFFPTDEKSRWRVLIDPSYFDTSFDKVGVLRHELGHTLGFRHEHIRSGAPAVCPDESATGTIDLTLYDPQSVMHYFCGGVGSRDLAITDVDRTGSQLVYGPSLGNFVLLEP